MYKYHIRVADHNIIISCCFLKTIHACRSYAYSFADDEADLLISVTQDDVEKELAALSGYFSPDGVVVGEKVAIVRTYENIELSVLHKLIADALIPSNILMIHGAAIASKGCGFVFLAPSGTGKTTHIMNWLKVYADTAIVNGDKPFVNVDKLLVYGTPWCGKEGYNSNIAVPLKALIMLERGSTNRMVRIEYAEAATQLLAQCYIPSASNLAIDSLKMIAKLESVPFYRLVCTPSTDAAIVAHKELVHLQC